MVLRRRNLLDAFRQTPSASGAEPVRPTEPKRAAAPAPRAPAERPAAPPRASPPLSSVPQRTPLGLVVVGFAVVVLAAGVYFAVTHKSEASAAPNSAPTATAPATSVPSPAPSAPPSAKPSAKPAASDVARTTFDSAFLDKKNRYTVRLIQYDNDENGNARAAETYRWLSNRGIPVVKPIRLGNDKHLILCAGAAATKDELVQLRDSLKTLRYPETQKSRPFESAFIDEIDRVAAR